MTAMLASALLDAPPPLRLLPTLLLTIAGTGALPRRGVYGRRSVLLPSLA